MINFFAGLVICILAIVIAAMAGFIHQMRGYHKRELKTIADLRNTISIINSVREREYNKGLNWETDQDHINFHKTDKELGK